MGSEDAYRGGFEVLAGCIAQRAAWTILAWYITLGKAFVSEMISTLDKNICTQSSVGQ